MFGSCVPAACPLCRCIYQGCGGWVWTRVRDVGGREAWTCRWTHGRGERARGRPYSCCCPSLPAPALECLITQTYRTPHYTQRRKAGSSSSSSTRRRKWSRTKWRQRRAGGLAACRVCLTTSAPGLDTHSTLTTQATPLTPHPETSAIDDDEDAQPQEDADVHVVPFVRPSCPNSPAKSSSPLPQPHAAAHTKP